MDSCGRKERKMKTRSKGNSGARVTFRPATNQPRRFLLVSFYPLIVIFDGLYCIWICTVSFRHNIVLQQTSSKGWIQLASLILPTIFQRKSQEKPLFVYLKGPSHKFKISPLVGNCTYILSWKALYWNGSVQVRFLNNTRSELQEYTHLNSLGVSLDREETNHTIPTD